MSKVHANCPKCGGRGFSGPRFRESMDYCSEPECLIYFCETCGYKITEPTVEQREARDKLKAMKED